SQITVTARSDETLAVVKDRLWDKAREAGFYLENKSRYAFKVTHTEVYLQGENQPLDDLPIIQFCKKKHFSPRLSLVEREESKEEKLMSVQIGSLIGRPLCWHNSDTDEA